MALVLSIETSTKVCSVALHKSGALIALNEVHIEQSHASKLALLIDAVISVANLSANDLNAVAISAGPGSYTGLRIGTSTAKGLCLALGVPLISVSSLEVMAYKVRGFNTLSALLCPMIDARRMEVYCYLTNKDLQEVAPIHSAVIDSTSFKDFLQNNKILFFGDGAAKCAEVITHSNAIFLKNIYPSAAEVGVLAFEKYSKNAFEDLTHFEPFYLKEFNIKKVF